ncbi:MAG: hypothetical protein IPN03_09345 [Holophagales bacterium]|nr:hypothetical protein [Holophagales bacterium]
MTSPTRTESSFVTARTVLVMLATLAVAPASLLAERPDVTARIVDGRLSPGEKGPVFVELRLGPKWHVNGHTPLEEFLVPTDVTLTTSSGQRLRVKYPEGELKRFAFSDKPLSVYAGVVRFEAELLAPPDSRGPVALSGEVSYQACTDEQCFPPARIPLRASVEIR